MYTYFARVSFAIRVTGADENAGDVLNVSGSPVHVFTVCIVNDWHGDLLHL